jgi:tetratricopeptide (TPR) repeat protein
MFGLVQLNAPDKRLQVMCKNLVIAGLGIVLSTLTTISAASAEVDSTSSSISRSSGIESLQELALRGRYFDAVVKYSETTTGAATAPGISEQLAAAKSAWALGLVHLARRIWDDVFANREFDDVERSRAMLARSILELQEENFEQARSIAEAAAQKLEQSELRAQFWLVIAEALKEQGALSLAEGYYKKAAEEGDNKTSGEATYLLGECQYKLGLVSESRYTYAGLDTASPFTAPALRRLAEIDLIQRNYEGVLNWTEEARESYPGEFGDGWTTYARVSALVELGRLDTAEAELNNFRVKHGDTDTWYLLALASLEAGQARARVPAEQKTETGKDGQKLAGSREAQ